MKLLAISLGISNRVVRELVLLVKVLGKINKDSRSFEDGESFVSDCGDASIRVDREEPWLLLLARAQVELVDAAMYMRVCVNSACIS